MKAPTKKGWFTSAMVGPIVSRDFAAFRISTFPRILFVSNHFESTIYGVSLLFCFFFLKKNAFISEKLIPYQANVSVVVFCGTFFIF